MSLTRSLGFIPDVLSLRALWYFVRKIVKEMPPISFFSPVKLIALFFHEVQDDTTRSNKIHAVDAVPTCLLPPTSIFPLLRSRSCGWRRLPAKYSHLHVAATALVNRRGIESPSCVCNKART